MKDFIEALPPGSLLADVGSGDGKYFGVNPNITSIGCDRSLKLLEVSKEAEHETFSCDAVNIPFRSDIFDATLCIAVLHHLSTIDRRTAVIRELVRITRPGGMVMIQAWAYEQNGESKRQFLDQDTMVPWRLNKRFIDTDADTTKGDSSGKNEDLIPVYDEGKCQHVIEERDEYVFQRYCHVYKEGELEDICSTIPQSRVVDSGWDKGNWFVQLEKLSTNNFLMEKGPSVAMPLIVPRKFI